MTAAPRAPAAGKPSLAALSERLAPWLLIAPAVGLLILFVAIPVVLSFIASLYQIPLTGLEWKFVGLANYAEAFADAGVRQALWNTVLYSAMTIVPGILLGLGLALLIESFSRGRAVLRTLLFLPVTANLVAMAIVFQWIFGVRGGFINELLALIGLGPVNFLGSGTTALPTLAAVGIWRYSAFNMVIYLAGLTTIPRAIHEAAAIDGIRGLTKVRKILWPLLRPSTIFVTVITFIQSVQVFETVSVMTGGGPLGKTQTLLFAIWQQGFWFFRLGYASALSFILLLVTVIAGLIRRRAISSTDVA